MSDLSLQEEEINSLESIYFPLEFKAIKDEASQWRITAFASIDVPQNFKIVNEADPRKGEIFVNHLPPITLKVYFRDGYPTKKIPLYRMFCSWLTVANRLKLRKRLWYLWKQNRGFAIIHTWIEYLKSKALSDLNIINELNITKLARQASPRPSKTSKKQHNTCLIANLELYNSQKMEEEFLRDVHKCLICFSEHLGSNSMRFKPCQHIFCRSCLREYFTSVINDGNCLSVKCPAYKCETGVFQNQVRELLPVELFEKYDRLLLNLWLDTKPNVIYCPRPNCQYPVMREGDDKLAECPTCLYAFCVYCQSGYHGIEPCKMTSESKAKLLQDYQNATMEEKQKLESRYGKRQIENLVNNTLSESWIEGHSKKCPKCGVGIEKSDGCNKMTCNRCGAYFCWLCSSLLDKFEPYKHYQDPKSPCNQLLFEFINDNDEDDDDWVVEVLNMDDSGSEDIETDDPDTEDEIGF